MKLKKIKLDSLAFANSIDKILAAGEYTDGDVEPRKIFSKIDADGFVVGKDEHLDFKMERTLAKRYKAREVETELAAMKKATIKREIEQKKIEENNKFWNELEKV